MAWESDLIDAVYTAPSGKKFTFNYDSKLSSETDLKTATFTFPERDGALVVPLGIGGRRFSFTCFFYGKKSKKEAEEFEEGLKERGYGELQHPLYGTHKVVPTGVINRSDDVVSGVGVSSVSVTFAETLVDVSTINSEIVSTDEINLAADEFEKKSAWEFGKDIANATIKGATWAANMYKDGLGMATKALKGIAQAEKAINTKFSTIEFELFSSIDNLMGAAQNVAVQTIKLMRLPGQVSINVASKIEGYATAIKSITHNFKDNPFNVENAKNQWASTRLMLESLAVSVSGGIVYDATKGSFRSRNEAVEAASRVLELYDSINQYETKNIENNYFVETGEGFGLMRDVVSKSVQYVVDKSFSLPTKKTLVLTRDRQIVELLYELYGNLDRIDEFIIDNNINYNELEVIPMGREVAYYV